MAISSYFKLINDDILSSVHQATLRVLARTGVVFQSDELLELLKANGADVSGQTVFFPEQIVEQAISDAPATFDWVGRNPERSIKVDVNQPDIHVCLNNGPIYIQDLDRGRRLGVKEDLVNLFKLAQHSNTCNIVGQIPVEPSDITGKTRPYEIFRQLLKHSDKPLFGYVGRTAELERMFEMMKISLGKKSSDESLFDEHRIAVSINPLSPLQFDKTPCETLLAFAKRRQPIMILTCAMAGVTSPIDPMGTVVLQNAEILAGIVAAQLVSKGTPVVYSPASAVPNLRSAGYITGSPISNLINMAGLQLARDLYTVPTRCMAGLTDSKTVDCQSGYETMQNYLMLAMSGVNMVNECFGILDMIMTVSYEKFVIDDEIMSRAAAVVRGMERFEDTFSEATIDEIGHGGSFLMHPTTMKHCRKFWTPSVSTLDSYDNWEKSGSLDVAQVANKKVKEILENCPASILDDDIDNDLRNYIDKL